MDEKEILSSAADTLTQKALRIEVDIVNPSKWENALIRLKIIKPKKTFEILPLVYAKGIRIAKELTQIDGKALIESGNIVNTMYDMLADHGEIVAKCMAIACGSARKEPDQKLIKFFLANLTTQEGAAIISKILEKVDVKSFMSTIISAKGMSLLKPRETIALGPLSAV